MTPETSPHASPHTEAVHSEVLDLQTSQSRASVEHHSDLRSQMTQAWPWVALGVLELTAILVFWVFDALPFMDLPAHAGIIALRHRFEASPFEARFFVLAPHLGAYSLFRFLGDIFTSFLGPIGAVRMLATLPVIATPAAVLFARKRLHGTATPVFGFVAIILCFGYMTLLGFASYLLGVAILIVALTVWLELLAEVDAATASPRRELYVALVTPLVFVAHGHAFIIFLLVAAMTTIATGRRFARVLRMRAFVPALLLAGYSAWVERASNFPEGAARPVRTALVPFFQGVYDKFTLLVTPTLMTRTGIDFLIGIGVWLAIVGGVIATLRLHPGFGTHRHTRVHVRALVAAALGLFVVFLVLPHSVGWFGFVDGRLVPLVLLLGLLALDERVIQGSWRGPVMMGSMFGTATIVVLLLVASYRFQAEASGYREVLSVIPSQSRVLNLPLDPNSRIFTSHPFVHYDKLILAERPVVPSDIWFHQGTALYPTPENPSVRLPPDYIESDLKQVDWPRYHLEDWDYVLIRTMPEVASVDTPHVLTLVEHRGGWWLFRNPSARPL